MASRPLGSWNQPGDGADVVTGRCDKSTSERLARLPNCVRNGSKVLLVRRNLLADGRGRWLALAASLIVAGGMLYAHDSGHAHGIQLSCCATIPAGAPAPASPERPPPDAPKVATPAEAELLAANAPATAATAGPATAGI
jgi:hypothetical protein